MYVNFSSMYIHFVSTFISTVASNRGEAEPESRATRIKVDEDRKHEYPFYDLYSIALFFHYFLGTSTILTVF